MKKYMFILILLNLTFFIAAQESTSKFFSNTDNNEFLFLNNLDNRNYIENNGYYFVDVPLGKSFRERISDTIEILDTTNVSLYELNVQFKTNDYRYYYVSNHQLLLVLKSIDHLKKEIENEQ